MKLRYVLILNVTTKLESVVYPSYYLLVGLFLVTGEIKITSCLLSLPSL